MELDERTKILELATRKFFESGITKVTVDEIATELGMSKKTLYKYFKSKDELLQKAVQYKIDTVEQHLTAVMKEEHPFEHKIGIVLTLLGRQVSSISKQFQYDLQRFAPSLWKEIETYRQKKILPQFKILFEQAQREGILRPQINPDIFYLVFTAAVQGVLTPKVLIENSFSITQAFRGVLLILLSGVCTERAHQRIVSFFDKLDQQIMESIV